MIRICGALASAGHSVKLIGVKNNSTPPLQPKHYQQKRLFTFFKKGIGFYAFYNVRLFFYLLFAKCDAFCCIDLDTMLPVWLAGKIRQKIIIYDAHEYFSQQKEIITRPKIYKVWHWIERTFVPKFNIGYTVSQSIAEQFKEKYGVNYAVIRNVPYKKALPEAPLSNKNILYQGAVNEARGLESLIPAMQQVDAELLIYGDGNFMAQTKKIIIENQLQHKVKLGPRIGNNVVILSGLQPGDKVITDGFQRLRDKGKITLGKPGAAGASGSTGATK